MAQHPYQAGTLGGDHAELVLDRHLGDAVAIDVGRGEIDHARHVLHHDVALPGRIFIPGQLVDLLRHADDVGTVVVIHIGDDYRVAAGHVVLDDVGAELDGAGGLIAGRGQEKANA